MLVVLGMLLSVGVDDLVKGASDGFELLRLSVHRLAQMDVN